MTRRGKPRTKELIAYHRKEIGEGYLMRGESQRALAKRLGISQAQVSNDLKALVAQWEREAAYSVHLTKARELQRIDYIFFEANAAWERSKRPKVSRDASQVTKSVGVAGKGPASVVQTRLPDGRQRGMDEGLNPSDELDAVDLGGGAGGGDTARGPGGKAADTTVVEATSKSRRSEVQQVGDPRFLDKMQWGIEMRLKLMGVPLTGAGSVPLTPVEAATIAAMGPGGTGMPGQDGGSADAPSFQEIARRLGEGLGRMTPAHRTNALNRFRLVLRMADELNAEILALPEGPVSGGFEEEPFPANAIIRDGQVVYLDEDEPPARRGEEPGES